MKIMLRQETIEDHSPTAPAIVVIHLVFLPVHHTLEESFQVRVVGLLLELQSPTIHKHLLELVWQVHAQFLQRNRQLLIHYLLILLLLPVRLQVLPRQRSFYEIQQHVHDALNVIPPPLLNPQVCIERSISGCPRQVFIISVGDMRAVFEEISLCKPEINNVDFGRFLAPADDEVIRFDIPVQVALVMNELNPFNHLVADHERSFQIEPPAVVDEQILQGLAEQVHDHHIELSFTRAVINTRDAKVGGVIFARQAVEYLGFVEKLWAFVLDIFKFDSHLHMVFIMQGHEHLPEGA